MAGEEKAGLALLKATLEPLIDDAEKAKAAASLERAGRLKERREREAAEAVAKAEAAVWSGEELALLAQAIKRFPAGSVHRWQKVADWVGGTRTENDCVSQARVVQARPVSQSTKLVQPPPLHVFDDAADVLPGSVDSSLCSGMGCMAFSAGRRRPFRHNMPVLQPLRSCPLSVVTACALMDILGLPLASWSGWVGGHLQAPGHRAGQGRHSSRAGG